MGRVGAVISIVALWSVTPVTAAPVPQAVMDMIVGGNGAAVVTGRIKSMSVSGGAATPVPMIIKQDDAYRRAINSSPLLLAERNALQSAAAGIAFSRSAFDPLFALRAEHTRTGFMARSAEITREYEGKTNQAGEQDGNIVGTDEETAVAVNAQDQQAQDLGRLTCVIIDGEIINPEYCSMETAVDTRVELASSKTPVEPEANVFAIQALQVLPWGSSVSAQLQSTRRIKSGYSTLNRMELINGSHGDPIGTGSNYPWTSAFFFTFNTPMPYARNFGAQAYGPRVNTEVANLDRDIGKLRLEQRSNEVLNQVAAAFWDLVRRQYRLSMVQHHLDAATALAQRGRRLFDSNNLTSYDMAQLDTELERTAIASELAWQEYLGASNLLVDLLNLDDGAVLVADVSVAELLSDEMVEAVDIRQMADQHPEVLMASLEQQKNTLLTRFFAEQVRPDISLVMNISYRQSDQVFGYKTWNDSYEHIFDPDQRQTYIGINYRYAFGQRAEKAAWSRSRTEQQQAALRVALARNNVHRTYQDAQSAQASTDSRLGQLGVNLDLAQSAYDRSGRMREQNSLTEFERVRTLQMLYQAVDAYIAAAVATRREQAQSLFAAGRLHQWYTAHSAKERQ